MATTFGHKFETDSESCCLKWQPLTIRQKKGEHKMIKERLENLFKKKNIETTIKEKEEVLGIEYFINNIADLLKINCPTIQSVGCVYESNGQVQVQIEFRKSELPTDAQYYGAYYLDEKDLILVPRRYPEASFEDLTLHFKKVTEAENLFTIAHELRHVWQKKYHENVYYKTNAINMEVINDISEIDADAFAISYIFSNQTPFTYADMPNGLEEICLQATADNGKRWKRSYELVTEYEFKNSEKIEDAKQNVDYDKINNYISIMKLNKMI